MPSQQVSPEIVDAEVVPEPVASVELATSDHHQPTTLFRTDNPLEVVERATEAADALKQVLSRQGLIAKIQGRDHLLVEAWTTLGSMLGVVPVVVWTKPIERGWEARVEARTLDGRTVGAAEAMCTRDERQWSKRDDYALRSMAQTRATSKALRGPLGFVVTLAGYEATPAEELPTDAAPVATATASTPTERGQSSDLSGGTVTGSHLTALRGIYKASGLGAAELHAMLDGLAVKPSEPDVSKRMRALTVQEADTLGNRLARVAAEKRATGTQAPFTEEDAS